MKFRTRISLLSTGLTALTLGGAFTGVWLIFTQRQERHLDEALVNLAGDEARHAAAHGLILSDEGALEANYVALPKWGAVYGADGHPLFGTSSFVGAVPPLASFPSNLDQPFDFRFNDARLRGVLVAVPGHPSKRVLVATRREDLDGDEAFLRDAMAFAFTVALAWAALLANNLARRTTIDHEAIVDVARRVSGGDLTARVRPRSRDPELAQLSADINAMIARLDSLVRAQQRFVAHAAHELRSPVTAVYGELSLALRKPRSSEEYRVAIEEALDSAKRLKSLTEDLLAMARLDGAPDDAPLEPVAVNDLVAGAAQQVTLDAAERKVTLDHPPASKAFVSGRRADLERVVRNLLENAIRHAPPESLVALAIESTSDEVRIVVTDSGPGVPSEDRDRIFEPFFRGNRSRASGEGSGLGLGIAREIARRHGGDVLLADGEHGGARFVLRLPAHEASTAT